MSGSAARASSTTRSEREIVVLLIQRLRERVERLWGFAASFRGPLPSPRPRTNRGGSASGAQHDQLTRDDLGDVARLLLAIFPRPVLNPSLDIDLVTLFQVLLGDVGQAGTLIVPADNAVPLRFFLLFAPVAGPLAAGRHRKGRHARAIVRATYLGIRTQIPDDLDFVKTAAHNNLQRYRRCGSKGAQHYIS